MFIYHQLFFFLLFVGNPTRIGTGFVIKSVMDQNVPVCCVTKVPLIKHTVHIHTYTRIGTGFVIKSVMDHYVKFFFIPKCPCVLCDQNAPDKTHSAHTHTKSNTQSLLILGF
ncbi:hypothetical protein LXL04_027392 [Taraxacum kok-saghyz]